MGELLYKIADLPLVIETPDSDKVASILTSYAPFRLTQEEAKDITPLVRFTANREVHIPDIDPIDTGEFEGGGSQTYFDGTYYYTEMELFGKLYRMRAKSDWSVVESDIDLLQEGAILALNAFLIPAYGMQIYPLGGVKLHGSVTMLNGRALLFMGTSGTGKSTHSMLWRRYVHRAELLNDDEPIVRLLPNGEVRVYGAPWSGKTHCYRNESATLAGMVLLKQAPHNKLTPANPSEALAALVMSASVLRTDSLNKQVSFDLLTDLLIKVPTYILECRPDKEAVSLTYPLIL